MKIVADQNIPLLQELFADEGEITALAGRTLKPEDVADADILLVRSVTKVNEELLKNSSVKFVGSCTIGTDHFDKNYLNEKGIFWTNAPGCNANAVVQYVFSAMAKVKPDWLDKTIGIIGCGNIGGRLYRRLKQLGISCKVYDPFLKESQCEDLVSFDEVLTADVITCHTPLTKTGTHPSYYLLDQNALEKIPSTTLLINSGRGPVIDNKALNQCLRKSPINIVLDVWEAEPNIDRDLLNVVNLGTPHIAGYSLEGKENGTWMVYQSMCEFLGVPVDNDKKHYLTLDTVDVTDFDSQRSLQAQINQLLLSCYDIAKDDFSLRNETDFDSLRKNYPSRREYTHFKLGEECPEELARIFSIIRGDLG